MLLDGDDITDASPEQLFASGLAHVPEDRQAEGLVGAFPVADNLVLNMWRKHAVREGPAARPRGRRGLRARRWSRPSTSAHSSIHAAASTLSGGNQQKVIVAREFHHAKKLLVASQPTRGLDVGSIQYIHGRIVAARATTGSVC